MHEHASSALGKTGVCGMHRLKEGDPQRCGVRCRMKESIGSNRIFLSLFSPVFLRCTHTLLLSLSKASGGIATVLATCFLSIGWALNVAALSTCRLVATDGFRDTENDNVLVTGLGLYTFEGSDAWGQSYCYIFEYTTLTSNFSYWVDSRMNAAR